MTDVVVGAVAAFAVWISMRLSLSVKIVLVDAADRAHPSGTLTLMAVPEGVNAT